MLAAPSEFLSEGNARRQRVCSPSRPAAPGWQRSPKTIMRRMTRSHNAKHGLSRNQRGKIPVYIGGLNKNAFIAASILYIIHVLGKQSERCSRLTGDAPAAALLTLPT